MTNTNGNFTVQIEKHIGVIAQYKSGWTKEINIISWNGEPPKYDIRDWSPDHKYRSKGVTLTADEMVALLRIMSELMNKKEDRE